MLCYAGLLKMNGLSDCRAYMLGRMQMTVLSSELLRYCDVLKSYQISIPGQRHCGVVVSNFKQLFISINTNIYKARSDRRQTESEVPAVTR